MSMDALPWQTGITHIAPNEIRIRGYPLTELMGRVSFAEAVYLLFRGDLPTAEQASLLEAILLSVIDHGVTPPSTQSARSVACTGAPLVSAVAAGMLAISEYHGGAVEVAMELFYDTARRWEMGEELKDIVTTVLSEYGAAERRLPGCGHRIHTDDPRTRRLLDLARELGLGRRFVAIAEAYARALAQTTSKHLPLNVDGAIAALLCELGFPTEVASLVFVIGRVPGLAAHVYEERTRQRPMRAINFNQAEYDGPAERVLPVHLLAE
jgi:citrate synthase